MTNESPFHSWRKQEAFLQSSQANSWAPQRPIQWILQDFPPRIKQLGQEANYSPPSSAKIKNEWSYTSTPYMGFYGMHKDNSTFTLTN
jgi:hypothetical protein